MGKRGGKKKGSDSASGNQTPMSIREATSGRKQTNSLKSIAKLQHLQNLAVWAGGEASVSSLATLFGRRFAATGEALSIPPDVSLFPCQRCETILQPGFNCTVRVVKNRAKTRKRGKKPISTTQNNVVYKCHFCSYENLKRGTSKGHMKEICPPKPKQPSKPKPAKSAYKKQDNDSEQGTTNKLSSEETLGTASPSAGNESSSVAENPSTPSAVKRVTLLDSKKRKRNKAKPKKTDESEANSAMADAKKAEVASSKRKRKGWTTLRDIAESNERERIKKFTNFSVPFTL